MSKRIINDVGHRPVSERRCRQGTSPPRGSRVIFPSAAARLRYWCGYGSHARRENRSRSAFPQCRPRPPWQPSPTS